MIVALLIAAIGVWIAGLVQLRSKPNSSNPGEIWGMLGLFFAMVFLFIAGWSLTVSVISETIALTLLPEDIYFLISFKLLQAL